MSQPGVRIPNHPDRRGFDCPKRRECEGHIRGCRFPAQVPGNGASEGRPELCESHTRCGVDAGGTRRMLRIAQLQRDLVALHESQDTAREFRSAVQIVSRPPDQICIQNQRFLASSRADGAPPGHRFSRNSAAEPLLRFPRTADSTR